MRALVDARRTATASTVRRGRLPGARRDARRPRGRARWVPPAAFSFYPGEEPRRVRRRRRARHRTTPRSRSASAPCASTASARSTGTSVEGWTARLDTIQALVLLAQAAAARRLERGAPRGRAPTTASGSRASATSACRRSQPGSEPVWHLFVVRTADPDALAALPRRARDRHRAATTPSRSHLSAAYAWLGYRRGAFPVAEALAGECLSLPIFPGMTEEPARRRRRGRRGVLRRVADAPGQRGAVPADRRRRVRRGRRSSRRSRTSTAAGSATTRGSGRSSRSSAARRSAPAARSRATRSSATASRSGTRSSSATA